MKQIYASKLYRSSKRKSQITAALTNASNSALVQQLAEDLDEEYKQQLMKQQAQEEKEEAAEQNSEDNRGGSSGPSTSGSFSSGGFDGGSFNPETDLVEYPEDLGEGEEGEEGQEPAEEGAEVEEPSEEINESVKIEGSTNHIQTLLTDLKSTLNLVDTTKGVLRTAFKENEVWIYYDDAINLNNIMTDVIDSVAKLYPTNLEFNRLARSDNAIVFDFQLLSSSECVKEENEAE